MSHSKTFEVEHEGTHYPTDAQMKSAFRAAVKDEDYKVDGDPSFTVVENTSGGPSKVRASFDVEAASNTGGGAKSADAKNAAAKTTTKTVGG